MAGWCGTMVLMSLLILMLIGWCEAAPVGREVYRMPQSVLKGKPKQSVCSNVGTSVGVNLGCNINSMFL